MTESDRLQPEGWKPSWKTPPLGFPEIHPFAYLCIEADFLGRALPTNFNFPQFFALLVDALGDHAVKIESSRDSV